MTDEALKARRAYQKAWRDANPDKIKQYKQNYWERVAKQQQQAKQNS